MMTFIVAMLIRTSRLPMILRRIVAARSPPNYVSVTNKISRKIKTMCCMMPTLLSA